MNGSSAAESAAAGELRVFISYGHDEYAALAERICNDLSHRYGCKAWFDREELTVGVDWERRIELGLAELTALPGAGRFVFLMTPHSVAGYCRNELHHALDKHVPVFPVMVVDADPPVSINLRQWLDMRDCVPVEEHQARYERQLGALWQALKTGVLAQEGEQGRVFRNLAPGWPDGRFKYMPPRFTGRQWLIEAFDAWIADPRAPQVFWITGPCGSGKSAIISWLMASRPEVLRAVHACYHAYRRDSDARQVVRSISWQLATQFPSVLECLAHLGDLEAVCREESDEEVLFDRLLVQVLRQITPRPAPVVVAIDGLDLATTLQGNALAQLIGRGVQRLPGWLRLVLTSERSPAIEAALQPWAAHDIGPSSAASRRDLDLFVQRHVVPLIANVTDPAAVAAQVSELAAGSWLYLECLRAALANGQLNAASLSQFPPGLGSAYLDEFTRRFNAHRDDTGSARDLYAQWGRPCLALLIAAVEPLPWAELARLLKLSRSETRQRIGMFGSFVECGSEGPYLAHRALRDWLTEPRRSGRFYVDALDGHAELADDAWAQLERGAGALSAYARRHLPAHLWALEDHARLESCVSEAAFVALASQDGRLPELAPYWAKLDPACLARRCEASLAALQRTGDPLMLYHAARGFGRLFMGQGQHAEAARYFALALKWASQAGEPAAIGFVRLDLAWCLRQADRFRPAIAQARKAAVLFQAAGIGEGMARVQSLLGLCYWHLHDDRQARDRLNKAVEAFRAVRDPTGEAEAFNHLGIVERSIGLYDEALAHLGFAETLCRRFGDEKGLGKCLNSLGTAHWWRGDAAAALRCYAAANRINKRIGQLYVRGLTANNMGYLLLERRQAARSLAVFAFARRLRRRIDAVALLRHERRSVGYEMMDVAGMSRACLALGRTEEARQLSREALGGLGKRDDVEDIERAYVARYLALSGGDKADRAMARAALQRAQELVQRRLARMRDPVVRERMAHEVPPVREVLELVAAEQRRRARPARSRVR